MPCNTLNPIKLKGLQDKPQPIDASPNTSNPNWNIRFEPSRSLIPPAESISTAKAMVYASTIHCSELTPAENDPAICGKAILTMDTSSCDTTKARLAVPTINPSESAFLFSCVMAQRK